MGIDIEKAGEAEQRGVERGARDDEALLLVLKLDVGAQGIDAGADAVLLQIGGLIVERLREVHLGLGRLYVGRGALAAEILGDDQQDALFASGEFSGAAAVHAELGGAVAAPQGQIEDLLEVQPRLERLERPGVFRDAGKRPAEQRFYIEALVYLRRVKAGLRQEAGAGHQALLFALRHAQVGEDDHGVLFEREVDGVAQGERKRRGFLRRRAGSQRQENEEASVLREFCRVHVHHHQYNQRCC